MSPSPTGYSSQSSPNFTFSFDIGILTPPNNWVTIFTHGSGYTYGGSPSQRHPSVFLTGTAQNSDTYLQQKLPQPIANRLQIVMAGNGGTPGSSGDNQELFSPPIPVSSWHRITFTVGSGTMTGYFDSQQFGSVSGSFTWGTTQPWIWFDAAYNSTGANISIRNAYFWNRVLSSSEISNIPSATI